MENQYATDLLGGKIVEAKYRKCFNGAGNPFIEALPQAMTPEEILISYNRTVSIPGPKDRASMNQYDLVDSVDVLDDFRVALPFHAELELQFHRALVASYNRRERFENRNANIPVTEFGDENSYHGKTVIKNMSIVPEGFTLLGESGCGKSTGISMMLEHYPQVIIHNKDTWQKTCQIVYIQVSCQPNSNFNMLYGAIGREIDRALGNAVPVYEKEVNRRRQLGMKKDFIRELIEIFSIGIIIFDEIELIDMTSTKENSIETLLTLTNETGVAIAAVGTLDAYEKLFKKRRTARRTGALIKASQYCENKAMFKGMVNAISAYQWRDKRIKYTAEMVEALFEATGGIVSDLVGVYKCIEKDHIMGKEPKEVTADYIRKAAEKYYAGLQEITAKERSPLLADSKALTDEEVRAMNTFLTNNEADEIEKKYNEMMARQDFAEYYKLMALVVNDIMSQTDEFKRTKVENAFSKVMSEEKVFPVELSEATAKTLALLRAPKPVRKTKKKMMSTDELRAQLLEEDPA